MTCFHAWLWCHQQSVTCPTLVNDQFVAADLQSLLGVHIPYPYRLDCHKLPPPQTLYYAEKSWWSWMCLREKLIVAE